MSVNSPDLNLLRMSGIILFVKYMEKGSRTSSLKSQKVTPVNVYFRSLIPPTVILNVAKLAFILKSDLAGLPYLV